MQTFLLDTNYCSETVFYAAVEEDCASGLVMEVIDDSNKVGAEFIRLHGCQQSCMKKQKHDLWYDEL